MSKKRALRSRYISSDERNVEIQWIVYLPFPSLDFSFPQTEIFSFSVFFNETKLKNFPSDLTEINDRTIDKIEDDFVFSLVE